MRYCQNDEEEIINGLLTSLGLLSKKGLAVEFGGGDGFKLSNVRHLKENFNWKIAQIDCEPRGNDEIIKEFINAENINDIFKKHKLEKMDLLSIDIDGNDYWVWKAITAKPKLVVLEFNHNIDFDIPVAIKYNPDHLFGNNDYYGASWIAFKQLGEAKGYTLVKTNCINMFFVRNDLVENVVVDTVLNKIPKGWPHFEGGEWVDV